MLRLAFTRSIVRAAGPARTYMISSRLAVQPVRYQSSSSGDRKATFEALNDLRRDWDAKVITYEELKPKTSQPSPVGDLILASYSCY